ncbi:hypothetical protein LZG74_08705 [Dyadobacter sp. CY327]|uniref:hypothetical protein n=1 Tax=Dyadobacter sp. CY327 TaxID=2907301 RepID=UPI001F1C1A9D|nr:hypothetical protein [Dyadobacter sp. CY327]MCE7070379.1 hypothetical protein [Dyadobacter sp. CY327]
MLFKILFPVLLLTGIYFLIKSIGRIMQVCGVHKIEFPAENFTKKIQIDIAGTYKISYKRQSLAGIIPTDLAFELTRESDKKKIDIRRSVYPLGSYKDLSGNRIVQIATFSVENPGMLTLSSTKSINFKKGDKLLIGAITGSKGFLAIFAIIISAIATIAGLVLSILAWMNKFS